MEDVLIGIIYETIVIFVASALLLMITLRMRVKSSTTIKKIFMIFAFLTLSIVGSWVSKILTYNGILFSDPQNLSQILINLVMEFRVSFVFVCFALYYSALLQIEIFKEEVKFKSRNFHLLIAIAISLLSLFLYSPGEYIFDVVVFFLVFVYMTFIYFPFMVRTLRTASGVKDPKYKKALQSLGIMSLCFMSIFLSFLLDRIIIMMTGEGYSVFYYLAWLFGLISLISAYLGYIKPKG